MADPKIKYDIEAAVKGEDDAAKMAQTLREVGDALGGEFKAKAAAASQALEGLAGKQSAVEAFVSLKRESIETARALDTARAETTRLAQELPRAAASTQALQTSQQAAAQGLRQAQRDLDAQRKALRALQADTQGAARKSDDYRTAVAALRADIRQSVQAVRDQRTALADAQQAAGAAARQEVELGKAFEGSKTQARALKAELQGKTQAVQSARAGLQALGVSTTGLAQTQRALQGEIQAARAQVATMVPAYQQAATAARQSGQAAQAAAEQERAASAAKVAALKAALQVEQSAIELQRQQLVAAKATQQARLQTAKAQRDEAEAIRAAIALQQIETGQLALVARAKRAEATAAQEVAAARRAELAAIGPLTQAQQQELQAADNHARALHIEAAAAQQAVLRTRELASAHRQAAQEQRSAADVKAAAIQSALRLEQSEIELQHKQLELSRATQQARLQAAQAQGNEAEAMRAGNALRQIEVERLGLIVRAKQAEAAAAQQNAAALRAELAALGPLTQAQQQALKAADNHARALALEASAAQQAAAATSNLTQAQVQNQRTLREGMASISTQLQRIQQLATVAVGGGYFGGLIKDVAATADEFKNLEARIKIVTGEGGHFTTSFDGVKRVALQTNSALAETGDLFTRLTRASQESGMAAEQAQARALGLAQTINQAMQLSGGSAESAKAALTQLIQGLQSGVLRGEEFNSVMEQAPRLAQALANGLQVTTGELRNLAGQGALTAEVVMKALEGQSDAVAREFGKLPPTVGRALQNLSSQWTIYVGEADKGMISSVNAAKAIDALAKNLDTVVTTLTTAGKLWAAFKIASLAADFTHWAATTLTATKALEANTAAATANTAAQRANAAAQAESAAAQAANTAATTANTAARAANAKAWADIGAFTRGATAAQTAATAATTAGTAAAVAKTGALGTLGKGLAGVTRLLGGPVGLVVNLVLFREEIAKGKDAVLNWAFSFTEAGKQLKAAEQELKRQEEAAKRNAEAAKAAAEAARLLAQRQEEARSSSFDLTKQAAGLTSAFDKLTKSGDSTAYALDTLIKNFDSSGVEGIRTMSAALNKLLADGKIGAEDFQRAWAKALAGQDLAKFEVLARQAFAAAGREADKLRQQLDEAIRKGASEEVLADLRRRLSNAMQAAATEGERVATMMDQVLREAVRRTGLEFDQLQGKIGAASRSAINDVEVIVAGLDKLKAEGVDTGRVLSASLGKAIQTVESQAAIDALRARVESLRQVLGNKITDGLLDQLNDKALELKDAMDAATPGINSVREAMKQLGITSDEALKNTAASAKDAYDTMRTSGQASARELSEAFKKAAEAAIAANDGVAPAWVKAELAVRGYNLHIDEAGKSTLQLAKKGEAAGQTIDASLKKGKDSADKLGKGLKDAGEDGSKALEKIDQSAKMANKSVEDLHAAVGASWDTTRSLADQAAESNAAAHALINKLQQEQYQRQQALIKQQQDSNKYFREMEGILRDARMPTVALTNATWDAVRALEGLDRQQKAVERSSSSARDGLDDLRVRLLELDGDEEAVARARHARDVAQMERQIKLTEIEAQRARVRLDQEEAARLDEEIRLLRQQIQLLDQIEAKEKTKRAQERQEREREKREQDKRDEERRKQETARPPAPQPDPAPGSSSAGAASGLMGGPQAPAPSGSGLMGGPTHTVNLNLNLGGGRTLTGAIPTDAAGADTLEQLMRELERGQRSSGR